MLAYQSFEADFQSEFSLLIGEKGQETDGDESSSVTSSTPEGQFFLLPRLNNYRLLISIGLYLQNLPVFNNNNLTLILRAFHEMIKRALHDFYLQLQFTTGYLTDNYLKYTMIN